VRLKIGQMFWIMMGLAVAAMALLPAGTASSARTAAASVLTPVAWPVRKVFGLGQRRLNVATPEVPAKTLAGQPLTTDEELRMLRIELATVTQQLEDLKRLNADRNQLGQLRQRCTPADVVSADAGGGGRQSLLVRLAEPSAVRDRAAVLTAAGLVGRVVGASRSDLTVQLATDTKFRVQGTIGRFIETDGTVSFQKLNTPLPLVMGTGGRLVIGNVSLKEATEAGVSEGDWVVLSDADWDAGVQGLKIGQVRKIRPNPQAPLTAEIELTPSAAPGALKQVMVLTR
jgi:cell shape-determining protein MreC